MRYPSAVIDQTTTEGGYIRICRHSYRYARSGPAVEHYIYFDLWGTPRDFLSAHFGLRSQRADDFAMTVVAKHFGPRFDGVLKRRKSTDCSMVFSLGRMVEWKRRESLYLPQWSSDELKQMLASACAVHAALADSIDTEEKLLARLIEDQEPLRWLTTNGAIRAAIIAYLARAQGFTAVRLRAILQARILEIRAGFPPSTDVGAFMEYLLDTVQPSVGPGN